MKFNDITRFFINSVYFIIVFLVAFAIGTQALARQTNAYNKLLVPIVFSVEKENIVISNAVTGRIEKVHVKNGDSVKQGDLLIELNNDSVQKKLNVLEKASNNTSAKTEALVLKSQSEQYQIKAPRDGVIYEIHAGVGSYLNVNSPLVTMFANDNVKLLAKVSEEQYAVLKQQQKVNIFSKRFEQVYTALFESVRRVGTDKDGYEIEYEIQFKFENPDEGSAFIQGEQLEIVNFTQNDASMLPSTYIANLWNSLIIGKAN